MNIINLIFNYIFYPCVCIYYKMKLWSNYEVLNTILVIFLFGRGVQFASYNYKDFLTNNVFIENMSTKNYIKH